MYGAEKSQQTVQAYLKEAASQPGKDWVFNPENPGKLLLEMDGPVNPLINLWQLDIPTS